MLSTKSTVNEAPMTRVLSDNDRKKIYRGALEILGRTGVKLGHPGSVRILSEAGARVDQDVVFIPANLVEEALTAAPETVLIYDRTGTLAMRLGGTNSYTGTCQGTPNTLTVEGQRRKAGREDVQNAGLVVDALDNIDFLMSMGVILDEPVNVSDLYQFREMLFNTSKPLVFTSHDKRGSKDIFQMASIAAGGEEELRRKPFIIHFIEPATPLSHSGNAVDKLIFQSEKNMPIVYAPAVTAGDTGPTTIAGTLALSIADSLAGITLAQLVNPGTPVITGGVCAFHARNTSTHSCSSPETALMHSALSEMSRYLSLPVFGTAGCSDSRLPDGQAALEGTFSLTTQLFSGANLVHNIGNLESGESSSLEQLVMSNEIISMVKRIARGIDTGDLRSVADLVDEVGPKGTFLGKPDTVEKFKSEIWEPQLIDRRNVEDWKKEGSKTMGDRVKEKAREILETHEIPELSKDKKEIIDELIQGERKKREVSQR
ncbi:MAG: trimethylamine methyltransferase family protein [Candidatus Bipolaricaulota bacterium]